jgi:hypothetical protein
MPSIVDDRFDRQIGQSVIKHPATEIVEALTRMAMKVFMPPAVQKPS